MEITTLQKSGMVEAKIRDIEARLSHSETIDPLKLGAPSKVVFGTTIKIEDIDSGEKKTYSIYGSEESNVEKGWISFESPIARQLMGKEVGDVVKVALPGGAREYEILEITVEYNPEADS